MFKGNQVFKWEFKYLFNENKGTFKRNFEEHLKNKSKGMCKGTVKTEM